MLDSNILSDIRHCAECFIDSEDSMDDSDESKSLLEHCSEIINWDGDSFSTLTNGTLEELVSIMEDMEGKDYWTKQHRVFLERLLLFAGKLEEYKKDTYTNSRSGRTVLVKPYCKIDGVSYSLRS